MCFCWVILYLKLIWILVTLQLGPSVKENESDAAADSWQWLRELVSGGVVSGRGELVHLVGEWREAGGSARQQVGVLATTALHNIQLVNDASQARLGRVQLSGQRLLSAVAAWQTCTQVRCQQTHSRRSDETQHLNIYAHNAKTAWASTIRLIPCSPKIYQKSQKF